MMSWKLPIELVSCLLLVLLGFAAWQLLDRDVTRFQVNGPLNEAEQREVQALLVDAVGGGVLSADINGLAERLMTLSWPRSVRVRRVWPDVLVVNVEKERVIARWGAEGYLNSAGKVLKVAEAVPGLPRLDCAHADPITAMEMFLVLSETAGSVKLRIEHLQQNLLGEWRVGFDNGVQLSLGAEDVTNRMNRFTYAYATNLRTHATTIAHIDARYRNGLAVKFTEMIAGHNVDAVRP